MKTQSGRQLSIFGLLLLLAVAPLQAQHQHEHPPAQPEQQHEHKHPPARPEQEAPPQPAPLPRLGLAQQGATLTLEQLQEMAAAHNPTLRQAQAELRAARGRQRQAGLYPNPVIGYAGDEIRGGKLGGGQHGAFVEQTVVLGGKLGLGREVFARELRLAEIEAEEQRLRVSNAVSLGYYQVLAAQEALQTQRGFVLLTREALEVARRLQNVGALDESEVLQAEIEVHQAELAVTRRQNHLRRVWTALAAVVGRPELEQAPVAGDLEAMPEFDREKVMEALVRESPTARIAEEGMERSEAMLRRAGREWVPDLVLRGGLQQNREHITGTDRRVGLQGFAEVGFQLPLFNRNQGNIEAARAESERAREETARVRLVLRERASAVIQNHENARLTAQRYRHEVLPRARRAYDLLLRQWGQMAASYPVVLMAQRTLFDLQLEYVSALEEAWVSSVALRGFLLVDGLEAPARPGEMDVPVREINIPVTRGAGRME